MSREIKEKRCMNCIHDCVCGFTRIPSTCKQYKERNYGEWVLDKEFSFIFNMYECSKCRFNGSKRWHYCPGCGAKMRAHVK